jgi:hypothetical protein
MAKTSKILLYILGFAIALSIVSNAFDGDFGWHLRFGQDVWSGHFPYLDTYTWSFQNQPWTNHEWGGDIFYWLVYNHFGYFTLVILTSLAVWAAFFIIEKTFSKKISAVHLAVIAVSVWSVGHILVMRLSMIAFLLFAILLWSMERIENGKVKLVWLWPFLFWAWAAMHGSWILGFIAINIYVLGALIQRLAPSSWQKFLPGKIWDNKLFLAVIAGEFAAAVIIIANPYGLKIWQEVIQYFSFGYYKQHIAEWLPSYTFPVYWKPLVIQAVAAVFAIIGYIRKKISIRHLLLFTAFSFSAWMYKRNAMFLVLVSAPIISAALISAIHEIILNNFIAKALSDKKIRFIILTFACLGLFFVNAYYIFTTHYSADIWHDQYLMEYNSRPFLAVEFLQKKAGAEKIKIFNDFNWGGYLNWQMPAALVYLDGRSAATWTSDDGKLMLAEYFEILDQPGGLRGLETNNVKYILLKKSNFLPMPPPDAINKLIFGSSLVKVVSIEKTHLEKDLDASNNWQLIYSDRTGNIWEMTGK